MRLASHAPQSLLARVLISQHWVILLPCFVYALYLGLCPIDTALKVGGDDGMELAKAYSYAIHPGNASSIWNDQPWLYTMCFGFLCRHFGIHAMWQRAFSYSCFCFLMLTYSFAFGPQFATLERLLVGVLFIFTPLGATSVVSAMVEFPVIAMVTAVGMLTILASQRHRPQICYAIGGAVVGLILQMKFTALVVVPTIWITTMFAFRERSRYWFLAIWCICAALSFVVVGRCSPSFNLHLLLGVHLNARQLSTAHGLIGSEYSPHLSDIMGCPACWIAALYLLWTDLRRHQIQWNVFFVLLNVMSAVLFAILQRPWWGYYAVQLYIPLVPLAAIGYARLMRRAIRFVNSNDNKDAREQYFIYGHYQEGIAAPCAMAALWIGFSFLPGLTAIKGLQSLPKSTSDRLVRVVNSLPIRPRSLFTTHPEYSFFLHLSLPPQLTVPSLKHLWMGGLDATNEFAILRHYKSDILILDVNGELSKPYFLKYVSTHYRNVAASGGRELWLLPRFADNIPKPREERLRNFQL